MRVSEFRQKEVVNVLDGKRLGAVVDLAIDESCGTVQAIMVPGPVKFTRWFKGDNDYVIGWEHIKKIGDDVVLVELDARFWSRYDNS